MDEEEENTWSLGVLSEGVREAVETDIVSVWQQSVSCVRLWFLVLDNSRLSLLVEAHRIGIPICSSRSHNMLSRYR